MGRLSCILFGILLAACGGAAAQFPFRYYNLKAVSYEGKLEGAKPEDDLPFTVCAPSTGKQNPCTAMLTDAFQKLKSDYQKLRVENADLRRQLDACK